MKNEAIYCQPCDGYTARGHTVCIDILADFMLLRLPGQAVYLNLQGWQPVL